MDNKKEAAKFTIQFNLDNPLHVRTVDILNKQNQRGKARYISNAVLHYENCEKITSYDQTTQLNETAIEAIVERILRNHGYAGSHTSPNSNGINQQDERPISVVADFADSLDDIDEGLIGSMLDAVEMLKRK